MSDERTQGALLLALGGISLRLGLTDAALAYVKAGLRPLLVISGVVLAVLGIAAVQRGITASRPQPDVHGHAGGGEDELADHEVDHGAHHPRVGWLLVIPLLSLLLVAPPPLGSFAAQRQSDRPPASTGSSFLPLEEPVDGVVDVTVAEFVFRALYDEERSLDGVPVRLSGFVTLSDEGGYRLTRFLISCCAADGQAIHVEISGDPLQRAPDTWVEVVGEWEPRAGHDPTAPSLDPPVLRAGSVTEIPAPAQPYEY